MIKKIYQLSYLTIAFCVLNLLPIRVFSQNQDYSLNLRNGAYEMPAGQLQEGLVPEKSEVVDGNYYRLIQFIQVPSQSQREALAAEGVNLIDYLSGNTYFSSIDAGSNSANWLDGNVRSISKIDGKVKLHPDLYTEKYPEWALSSQNKIQLNVICFKDVSIARAIQNLQSAIKADVLYSNERNAAIRVEIKISDIDELVAMPFTMFIEPIDAPAKPENYTGRTLHRSNVIAGDAIGSRKYDGSGIHVGMHDDGIIGPHIDYQGRIPATFTNGNSGDHGDHVAGTIMGGGNLDPKHKGMAFGAELFVYGASNNNYDSVPAHYLNEDVIITSKSYSNGCNTGYTSLSRQLDTYVRQYPSLMHVFSAGNDGTSDCGYGAGSGWGNITGGHKAGKNVITVANLNSTDGLANSSSRGPAADGRIKPDVSAKGTSVISTSDPNLYVSKTGTSMSCPGVSGSLAQLYHAYKDLNSGLNPPSALMKAAMLNSADDIGNPGPDFRHGWGRINNLRAVEIIERNQYFSGSLSGNDSATHDITVPANVKQVKVMVLWNDYEASSSASPALVNNIDFKVEDPGTTVYLPWVLDPTPNPSALNANAVRGIDNLNNMEQVTIDNPSPGVHTATVVGKVVPQGPQDYYLVYSFIMDEITVTYPIGGESLVPNETEIIRWDAYGSTGTFTVEYSSDNGSSWNQIGTAGGSLRHINWNVPNIVDGDMLVRVTNGGLSDVSDTTFSVIRVPSNLKVDWACPDSIRLSWNSVTGAIAYEVSKLGQKYMDSTASSTQTFAVITGIKPNQVDWFSVRAKGANGIEGRRAIAIEKPTGTFGCPIPNDVAVGAVVSPVVSLPDCRDNTMLEVTVELVNEGLNTLDTIPVNYRINGGAILTESYTGNLAASAKALFTFTAKTDLSSTGNYEIEAWTSLGVDQNEYNDSAIKTVASYATQMVTLPWSEDFETFFRCGTFTNCEGTTCAMYDGWHNHENLTIDDIDWRTDEGGTNSNNTGPTVDHNPGTATGNYLYTEVSGDCSFKEAFLLTPCIDLSNTKGPELTFWHHMFGTDIGSLAIDVLHNGKWDLDKILYTATRGDEWRESILSLRDYAGDTINIRFRATSANGPFGDIAIDDISIVETDSTVGIIENVLDISKALTIYPNPTDGIIQLTYDKSLYNSVVDVQVMDAQGRMIQDFSLSLNKQNLKKEIDLRNLGNGFYLIRINGEAVSFTDRIIIQ